VPCSQKCHILIANNLEHFRQTSMSGITVLCQGTDITDRRTSHFLLLHSYYFYWKLLRKKTAK
jgi:hypothetical protein